MHVREGMTAASLTVGPGHTLREAAALMHERNVGSAIVIDGDQPGPGLLTERDLVEALAHGLDPAQELVGDHLTSDLVFAAPDWSLERAAAEMVRGGFRHLIVVDGGETVGILSMRDIVRCWTEDGATSEVPSAAQPAPGGVLARSRA